MSTPAWKPGITISCTRAAPLSAGGDSYEGRPAHRGPRVDLPRYSGGAAAAGIPPPGVRPALHVGRGDRALVGRPRGPSTAAPGPRLAGLRPRPVSLSLAAALA